MIRPKFLTRDQLVDVLEEITERVKIGDSFEGHLEYLMPWSEEIGDPETDPTNVDGFRVSAGFRVGNRQGQGGFAMIGDHHSDFDPRWVDGWLEAADWLRGLIQEPGGYGAALVALADEMETRVPGGLLEYHRGKKLPPPPVAPGEAAHEVTLDADDVVPDHVDVGF